jgi:DNA-binding CsgD family transcriptional regulator/tetratricopeptide (TPR) repeat protein
MAAFTTHGALTERQTEIMALVRKGLTNQDICGVLGISANTVKVHLANIYKILDVANRTEAVTVLGESVKTEAPPIRKFHFRKPCLIVRSDGKRTSLPDSLTTTVVQYIVSRLQLFETFQIQLEKEPDETENTYIIAVEEKGETPGKYFVCMHQLENSSILWTDILVIDDPSQLTVKVDRMVSTLHWKFELAAAERYRATGDKSLNGWDAVYGIKHLINHREKKEWHNMMLSLRRVQQMSNNDIWSLYGLGLAWYVALLEKWCVEADGVRELMSLGKKAMQVAPNSQYAWSLMAFIFIVEKRYQDAIGYLTRVVSYNPYNLVALQVLAQIYTLENQCTDGIRLMEQMKMLAPEFYESPTTQAAEAVLLFFHGDYDSCRKRVDDALFVLPEFLIPRLLKIALEVHANNKTGVANQANLLRTYHPNFNADSFAEFVSGVHPKHLLMLQDTLKEAGL